MAGGWGEIVCDHDNARNRQKGRSASERGHCAGREGVFVVSAHAREYRPAPESRQVWRLGRRGSSAAGAGQDSSIPKPPAPCCLSFDFSFQLSAFPRVWLWAPFSFQLSTFYFRLVVALLAPCGSLVDALGTHWGGLRVAISWLSTGLGDALRWLRDGSRPCVIFTHGRA